MLFLKASLVLLLMAPTFVLADCPDFTFKCPSGKSFIVNTCWSWKRFSCQTCRSIFDEMKSRCPKYSCRGSVNRWYAQNNGCSIPGFSDLMTAVFRASCAIHDICYGTPGMTQWICDKDFHHNMAATCAFPGLGTVLLPVCWIYANSAFAAVLAAGGPYFNRHNFARSCRRVY